MYTKDTYGGSVEDEEIRDMVDSLIQIGERIALALEAQVDVMQQGREQQKAFGRVAFEMVRDRFPGIEIPKGLV